MTEPLVAGCDSPLATRHDVALLDLDGVLYVGPDAVPGAPDAVRAAAAAGMRPAYVTNNASRTPEAVAAHLRELGLPAETGDVVTSAQAAATLVADRVPPGSAVLVVGGEGLRRRAARAGPDARCTRPGRRWRPWCRASTPDVGWRQLAEGAYAVATGVPWIASNMDATIPTPRGTAPGNGALVGVVARTVGRPPDAVAGKPETPLHQESVQRTGAEHPLVVGDRLDTDIEGANRAGVPSLLVLTGVEPAGRPAARRAGAAADLPGGRPGVRADASRTPASRPRVTAGPAAAGPCRWPGPR